MTPNTPSQPRKTLRLPQVKERTGLGHDSIYRLGRLGLFPRPIRIGLHASGWLESEVEEYLARCQAERDAGPKKGRRAARSASERPERP